MRIGDQVHIFDLGRVINGRVIDVLMGGTVLAVAAETRDATYMRPADEVHPGWIMLGHDARSSGLGGAS